MNSSSRAAELRTIATRWMVEGWQKGRVEIVDELHAPGFVDHDPAGRSPDREGFKQGIADLYAAFPDFHAEIDRLVVDADDGSVAIRWRATGTHSGAFLGVAPTGTQLAFKGIEIIRIADGKIVERWGEWDGLDLFQQLGL